jgi:hypothetical protein
MFEKDRRKKQPTPGRSQPGQSAQIEGMSGNTQRPALLGLSVVPFRMLPVQHAHLTLRKLGLHHPEGGFHVRLVREQDRGEVGPHATSSQGSTRRAVQPHPTAVLPRERPGQRCGGFEGGALGVLLQAEKHHQDIARLARGRVATLRVMHQDIAGSWSAPRHLPLTGDTSPLGSKSFPGISGFPAPFAPPRGRPPSRRSRESWGWPGRRVFRSETSSVLIVCFRT